MSENTKTFLTVLIIFTAIYLSIACGMLFRPGGLPYWERQDNTMVLVIPDDERHELAFKELRNMENLDARETK